jgi:hypothetical protein
MKVTKQLKEISVFLKVMLAALKKLADIRNINVSSFAPSWSSCLLSSGNTV